MTKTKLMHAAFHNFGKYGYNGGSLAQIADEIGIKKQSIYTYFKSKDDLYLAIFDEALQFELAFMKTYMTSNVQQPIDQKLLPLLQQVEQRMEQYVETKFFIRTLYLTPQHLEQTLNKQAYYYLDYLEQLFKDYFSTQLIKVSAQDAAISFLALLDSLYVEMLYGGSERFLKRLQASWKIFYRGITN